MGKVNVGLTINLGKVEARAVLMTREAETGSAAIGINQPVNLPAG